MGAVGWGFLLEILVELVLELLVKLLKGAFGRGFW